MRSFNSIAILIVFAFFYFSCKEKTLITEVKKISPEKINDSALAKDYSFNKGDVRRYGLLPNKPINKKLLNKVLTLGEKGLTLTFPKGLYETNLIIEGKKNLIINFEDTSFEGQIQIIDTKNKKPSNSIYFQGKVTSYSKFFTRNSSNIFIDTLILKSDTIVNPHNKRNLGCSIYAGTQNLLIKNLVVEDLGSGDNYYKFSHAALQIHGWKNNPKKVTIYNADIKSSDRHGAYITGENHEIKNLSIGKVGLGDYNNIHGLGDALDVEIDTTTALWINRCTNSRFERISIDTKRSKLKYTVNFDEGSSGSPTIIDTLIIKNRAKISYKSNDLTNVVVRHYYD